MLILGYQERQRDRAQELLWLAWHQAALARQEKLPSLEKLLKQVVQPEAPKVRLELDELIEDAKAKGLRGPWDDKK